MVKSCEKSHFQSNSLNAAVVGRWRIKLSYTAEKPPIMAAESVRSSEHYWSCGDFDMIIDS